MSQIGLEKKQRDQNRNEIGKYEIIGRLPMRYQIDIRYQDCGYDNHNRPGKLSAYARFSAKSPTAAIEKSAAMTAIWLSDEMKVTALLPLYCLC